MESNKLTMTRATIFNDGVINYYLIEDISKSTFRASSHTGPSCRCPDQRYGVADFGAIAFASRSNHRKAESQERDSGHDQVAAPAFKPCLVAGKFRCDERRGRAKRNANHTEDQEHHRLLLRSQPLSYPTGR